MDNEKAKSLVTEVFGKLKSSRSAYDFEGIVEGNPVLQKNRFDPLKYPSLKIKLSKEDIYDLKERKVLSEDNKILPPDGSLELSPLEKLLYSVLWKNGDLGKEKHIVEGVLAAGNEELAGSRDRGLVFYQYGKHLANREQPIVDQHTIRAFLLFKNIESDDLEITRIRKSSALQWNDLSEYMHWIHSSGLGGADHQFHIDKVLFSLGKSIKITKR